MKRAATADLAPRVKDYFQSRLDEMADYVKKLALLESPSNHPDTQKRVQEALGESLSRIGYQVRIIPGRESGGHLYARPDARKRGRPCQMLLGHTDTVWPLGTLREMPVVIEDGNLSGPGVYDMKGGLTQIIFALRCLHHLELRPAVTPLVFLNSDEETGSHESEVWIRRLAPRVCRVFVLEPSLGREGLIKTARKGIGQFTISVRGRAAHAGLEPESGASAILELSYVIQKLFQLNDPARGVTVNVGTIDGGLRPNVVAPESKAVVDVRVPSMEDAREIEQAIYALEPHTPGVHLLVDGSVGRPPLEPTPRNRRLWKTARRLGRQLGLDLREGSAGGASDGNTTSLFAATLDGLGAVGGGAHASHEFLHIESLAQRGALLALLLMAPPERGEGKRRDREEAQRLKVRDGRQRQPRGQASPGS
ncbi:MAG TPA: M20 family metallopeptidase [Acidobacteriota bacterium]|nr:M20 family metallopeptidase [Acidobacteriota bacterium]